MSYVVAIDESGDTGSDSRFFTMVALITTRSRNLLSVSKSIPKCTSEYKFYRAPDIEIVEILRTISISDVEIVFVSIDKYNYSGEFYGKHGPKLYQSALKELLSIVFKVISGHDVNIFVDDNSFISRHELDQLSMNLGGSYNVNVKKSMKAISSQNKCIQLADIVVGSIQRSYERDDCSLKQIIDEKISVARQF